MKTKQLFSILVPLLLWMFVQPAVSKIKTDSLIRHLAFSPLAIEEEISLCEQLVSVYLFADFNLTRAYGKRGLALAHKSGNKKKEGKLCRHLSVAYELNGMADSAKIYKLRMLTIGQKTRDKEMENLAIFYLGNGYYATSSFDSAIYYYQKVLPYYEQTDEAKAIAIRANIGTVYVALGAFEIAKP